MSDEIKLHLIQRTLPPDPTAEKRKRDRENGRLAALEFANEALLATVSTMRSSKDPNIVLKAAKEIMNRAWGTPKNVEDESKVLANRTMLEVLAQISTEIAAIEHVPDQSVPVEAEEITYQEVKNDDDQSIESLFLPDRPEDEPDGAS